MSGNLWRLPERFDFNGRRIAWGFTGDGPPAIVLHGAPFSSVEWRRIAPWLARERRIYYFDMLGYGRSEMPNADVSRGVSKRDFRGPFSTLGLGPTQRCRA
jgi:pimeloyl-ACP methyl ester carboxylesterase